MPISLTIRNLDPHRPAVVTVGVDRKSITIDLHEPQLESTAACCNSPGLPKSTGFCEQDQIDGIDLEAEKDSESQDGEGYGEVEVGDFGQDRDIRPHALGTHALARRARSVLGWPYLECLAFMVRHGKVALADAIAATIGGPPVRA